MYCMIFGKPDLHIPVNNHLLHHNKSHLLNYSYYTKYATQDAMISNTIISILQYCYSYVIHCNYIVTLQHIAIYIDTFYR